MWLNTQDAAKAGLTDGERTRLRNGAGAVKLIARIDESVLPGAAISYKCRCPSVEGSGVNVNFVHRAVKADMSKSTSVHTTQVIVEPIWLQTDKLRSGMGDISRGFPIWRGIAPTPLADGLFQNKPAHVTLLAPFTQEFVESYASAAKVSL